MSKKLLRKKLALMLATLKKKRPYYCEVEYLESSGTQYINTGYKPKTNTRVLAKYYYNSWVGSNADYVFGVFRSPNNYGLNVGSARQYFNVTWGNNIGIPLYGIIPQTGKIYTADISKNGYIVNGNSYGELSTETINSSVNMYLFWSNGTSSSGMNGRIYYFEIYDNGTLVRDFIPVLDWDMTPCMYDKVSGQLFYNQGTGSFTYGREIHYVEYLESTGTQCIDTRYIPTNNSVYKFKAQCTQDSTGTRIVFGSLNTGNTASSNAYLYNSGKNARWGTSTILNTSATVGVPHTCKLDKNGYTVDGNMELFTADAFTGTSTNSIVVFGFRTAAGTVTTGGKIKLWHFTIEESGNVVRDYYPAIDENDTFFMFDKITHTAYNNVGSGSFIGPTVAKDGNGKIIENEYE